MSEITDTFSQPCHRYSQYALTKAGHVSRFVSEVYDYRNVLSRTPLRYVIIMEEGATDEVASKFVLEAGRGVDYRMRSGVAHPTVVMTEMTVGTVGPRIYKGEATHTNQLCERMIRDLSMKYGVVCLTALIAMGRS